MKTLIVISMSLSSFILPHAIMTRNITAIAGSVSGVSGAVVWLSKNKKEQVVKAVEQVATIDTLEATFEEMWKQENNR